MIPNIFISSTIEDLHYLRDAFREAILELEYRPVMSERCEVGYINHMTAAESCYRSIEQCQMGVVIIGHRYGKPSEEGGISVTHKEFRTAREHDIPLIAFAEAQVLHYKQVFDVNPDAKVVQFPNMDHPELTFSLIDEIVRSGPYNGLFPFSYVAEAKRALKLQIADRVGESLSQGVSPMRTEIKDVLAEIKTLRHELLKQRDLDPNFLIALRFLLDEHSGSQLRHLIEHTIGPVDKAIPLLITSGTLGDFIAQTGYEIAIVEDSELHKGGKPHPGMIAGSTFLVPSPGSRTGFAKADYMVLSDKRILMTEPARRHIEGVYQELKTLIGTASA
jgi:hypothetical protein